MQGVSFYYYDVIIRHIITVLSRCSGVLVDEHYNLGNTTCWLWRNNTFIISYISVIWNVNNFVLPLQIYRFPNFRAFISISKMLPYDEVCWHGGDFRAPSFKLRSEERNSAGVWKSEESDFEKQKKMDVKHEHYFFSFSSIH